jgi:hypothetical protein
LQLARVYLLVKALGRAFCPQFPSHDRNNPELANR